VVHEFRYGLFMVYLDLAELDRVFNGRWLWSTRRSAVARFDRRDHMGDEHQPLDESVRDLVQEQTGTRPAGPIRLLTHLRYFGYCFNPVSFYYCFAADGETLQHIVAEVNNTPWGERHCYVLPTAETPGPYRFEFGKKFHVSPFMPMDLTYDWRFARPSQNLSVHMENLRDGEKIFDATLNLDRREVRGSTLARALVAYPLMTAKVLAAIHWQALKLWLKRCPVYTHPEKLATTGGAERAKSN
jgi:DUF1365 family protein